MEEIVKTVKSLSEYGALHNSDCPVNSEDGGDVGEPELGCCEHMKGLKDYSVELVEKVFEYVSHDVFDNEEQRVAGLKMYVDGFKEKLKEENI